MELTLTRQSSVLHRGTRTLMAMALIVLAIVVATRADAHTPHDSISGIAVSPTYATDGKVFVIAANRLLVTSAGDPYGFKPIVRGLPRAPENGESLAQMAISASNPAIMYLSSRVGGIYRSTDGGRSWQQAANGLPASGTTGADVTAIAVDPKSPDVVLAAGSISGLYRTTDGGQHWRVVPGYRRVPVITFVPGTSRVLIGDGAGRVSSSDNSGATWKIVAHGPGGPMSSIATTAAAPGGATIFAGTTRGALLRSTNDGATFSPVGSGLPAEAFDSIALSPDYAHDHMLWIATYTSGIFRSTDGGSSWKKTSQGLSTDPQAQAVHVSEFRSIAVAVGAEGKRTLFEAGFDGLFRSDDDGSHWVTVETLTDYIVGIAVSPDYAHDSTVAVASYVKGAYLSTDRGATWSDIDGGLAHEISAGNKFAPVKRLHNIVFSPDYATDHTIFSNSWTAFLKSTDSGKTWATIEVAPASAQTVLRQFVIGLSPAYSTDHTIYLGTRQGDVFRSTASGDKGSWVHLSNIRSGIRSFAFDPTFPTHPVIYAGTTKGVVQSVDGGRTWADSGPSTVAQLAISPRYTTDGTVFAGTLSGLFVTRNKGQTWSLVTAAPLSGTSDIEAIAVSPDYASDHMLLISIGGQGLYRSTDGGATFTALGRDLLDANIVIADFTNPTGTPIQFSRTFAHDRTIFAYANQDVVRSTDAGATWAVLQIPSGLDFLKKFDPSLLGRYDATSGGGTSGSTSHSSSSGVLLAVVAVGAVIVLAIGAVVVTRRRRGRATPPPTETAEVVSGD